MGEVIRTHTKNDDDNFLRIIKQKNMYLTLNLIVIILLYQFLMVYTLPYDSMKKRSEPSSISDVKYCSLWVPKEDAPKMPIAITAISNHVPMTSICSNQHEIVCIKPNSEFKLSCGTSEFTSVYLNGVNDTKEVDVKCLERDILEYKGKIHTYKEFKCKDAPNSKLKTTEREKKKNDIKT